MLLRVELGAILCRQTDLCLVIVRLGNRHRRGRRRQARLHQPVVDFRQCLALRDLVTDFHHDVGDGFDATAVSKLTSSCVIAARLPVAVTLCCTTPFSSGCGAGRCLRRGVVAQHTPSAETDAHYRHARAAPLSMIVFRVIFIASPSSRIFIASCLVVGAALGAPVPPGPCASAGSGTRHFASAAAKAGELRSTPPSTEPGPAEPTDAGGCVTIGTPLSARHD